MTEPNKRPLPQASPEPAFFDNAAVDNLIAVVLELGSELWVQRQRMRLIEKLLAQGGVVTAEAIERYAESDTERAAAASERQAVIDRIYGAFARPRVAATPSDEP